MSFFLGFALGASIAIGGKPTLEAPPEVIEDDLPRASDPDLSMHVHLRRHLRFDGLVVPEGSYLASIQGASMRLLHRVSGRLFGPIALSPVGPPIDKTRRRITLKRRGKRTQLIAAYGGQRYAATGRKTKLQHPDRLGETPAKSEAEAPTRDEPSLRDARTEWMTERIEQQMKGCVERAHKRGWKWDPEEAARCVCPHAAKWRMQPGEAQTFDLWLQPGRMGLSASVTKAGKVGDCDVWLQAKVGEKPASAPKP